MCVNLHSKFVKCVFSLSVCVCGSSDNREGGWLHGRWEMEGGVVGDVGSECLLFAIIVVITASTGIAYAFAPASLIITIPPRRTSPLVNLQYRLSRISLAVTQLKTSSFAFPSVFLFVLFSCSLCFKEVCGLNACVHVCVDVCVGRGGVSEAGSSDRLCSAFQALIETYCQSDKHICMQSVLFWLLTTLLISSPSLMWRSAYTLTHSSTQICRSCWRQLLLLSQTVKRRRESWKRIFRPTRLKR